MRSPPLSDPATLLATVGAAGLLPWAPGTWGSLVGVAFAWIVTGAWNTPALVAACAILFLGGWWASERLARRSGIADPGFVVIDEVVGQALVLAIAPRTVWAYAAGFLLFRFFDILKPWPVHALERKFRNGFGIMIDDVAAASEAALVLYVGLKITG